MANYHNDLRDFTLRIDPLTPVRYNLVLAEPHTLLHALGSKTGHL